MIIKLPILNLHVCSAMKFIITDSVPVEAVVGDEAEGGVAAEETEKAQ